MGAPVPAAAGTPVDWRFDVVWFAETHAPPIQFGQDQFDALNERGGRGHHLVMPTAEHLNAVRASGNVLCAYVNDFNGEGRPPAEGGGSANAPAFWGRTAAGRAAEIEQWYTDSWSVDAGDEGRADPAWIFLNEISRGAWTNHEAYPSWVAELAAQLELAGFSVVVFSPITLPAQESTAWASGEDPPRALEKKREAWGGLADHAYVAVESYLAGSAIIAAAGTLDGRRAWCKERYTAMLASYEEVGVPRERLFLTEHFGQTLRFEQDATGGRIPMDRGRAGVSHEDWIGAINARCEAAKDLALAGSYRGYATYAWGYNYLNADTASLVDYERVYAAHALPGQPVEDLGV
jgi:hypothetical protein